MLRDGDSPDRRIEKLTRINAALVERLDRADASRGSHWMLFQTAAVLEQELVARNRDLEQALAHLEAVNRELAQAREAADEANRAKSRFLRAASHDLLQPLSAAKLFLSHLGETVADPLQIDLVARIGSAFEATEELIRALLDISRLESGRVDLRAEPVSLGRLFQRLAADFQAAAEAKGLELRFVPSSATVLSHPAFLRRIAQNLVSNAIKYTPRGRVLVGCRRAAGCAWLEVHDTGPGIAPADRERVFLEFERLDPHGEAAGSGLGLSIVRRACARLGHRVEIAGEPGRGAVFRVRLPLGTGAVAPAEPALVAVPADPGAMPALVGRRILVIENDPAMRDAFALLLRRWGMDVAVAEGGRAALTVAGAHPPDLILSDYRLDRDETGLQAITALRRRAGWPVPALLVTAEADPRLKTRARRLGARLLAKPVADAALRAALLALIEGRQAAATAAG